MTNSILGYCKLTEGSKLLEFGTTKEHFNHTTGQNLYTAEIRRQFTDSIEIVIEQKGKYTKSGKPDGLWKWWYDNKQLQREETYVRGKEEGEITEYFEDGKIATKGQYEEGEETGKWLINNGDYKEEGNFKNGEKDGLWIGLYDNDKKAFEGSYIDGNPNGKHEYWFYNGQTKKVGEYIMGKEEGTWKHYNEDGSMALIILYKDGQEIKIDGVKIDVQGKIAKEKSGKSATTINE